MDGWIYHGGGSLPVGEDVLVDVKFRCGETYERCDAGAWIWRHFAPGENSHDIIAYHIHKES